MRRSKAWTPTLLVCELVLIVLSLVCGLIGLVKQDAFYCSAACMFMLAARHP